LVLYNRALKLDGIHAMCFSQIDKKPVEPCPVFYYIVVVMEGWMEGIQETLPVALLETLLLLRDCGRLDCSPGCVPLSP